MKFMTSALRSAGLAALGAAGVLALPQGTGCTVNPNLPIMVEIFSEQLGYATLPDDGATPGQCNGFSTEWDTGFIKVNIPYTCYLFVTRDCSDSLFGITYLQFRGAEGGDWRQVEDISGQFKAFRCDKTTSPPSSSLAPAPTNAARLLK